jgi:hypothetical protein
MPRRLLKSGVSQPELDGRAQCVVSAGTLFFSSL